MPPYVWTNPRDVYIRVALNLSGESGSRAGNAGSRTPLPTPDIIMYAIGLEWRKRWLSAYRNS